MGYKEDLKVDRYSLETLWENHQDLYIEWTDTYAEAIDEKDKKKEQLDYEIAILKEKLEEVKAELDLDIRNNWEIKYKLPKVPTESMVQTVMSQQSKYKEAQKRLRDRTHELKLEVIELETQVAKLKGAKEAFDHRKAAMENLTKLLLGGFYAAKLPKEVREEVKQNIEDKVVGEQVNSLNASMRKRRKLKEKPSEVEKDE